MFEVLGVIVVLSGVGVFFCCPNPLCYFFSLGYDTRNTTRGNQSNIQST